MKSPISPTSVIVSQNHKWVSLGCHLQGICLGCVKQTIFMLHLQLHPSKKLYFKGNNHVLETLTIKFNFLYSVLTMALPYDPNGITLCT